MRSWSFNVLPPPNPKVGVAAHGPVALPDVHQFSILFDEIARHRIEQILDGVMKYEADHRESPTKIVVSPLFYEAIAAMISTEVQCPILPEQVKISGISMDIVVDPTGNGFWLIGSARDEYLRAKYKELANGR